MSWMPVSSSSKSIELPKPQQTRLSEYDIASRIERLRDAVNGTGHKAFKGARKRWLVDALMRTEDFYKNGPRGPVTWVLTLGKDIPILEGAFNGLVYQDKFLDPVYIARGFVQMGIQVGIASPKFDSGALLGWGWNLKHEWLYETLVVSPRAVRWVESSGGPLDLAKLTARPVEGGYEESGEPLYIAQAYHDGAWRPGKHSAGLPAAHIPHNERENLINPYRILCYVE